jgi:hypothetical protein
MDNSTSNPNHPAHPRWQVLLRILELIAVEAPVISAPFFAAPTQTKIATLSAETVRVTDALASSFNGT